MATRLSAAYAGSTWRVPLTDESDVHAVREAARCLAAPLGFGETTLGRLDLVATETSSNALVHGGGGEVLLRAGEGEVELIALDRGPGIADVGAALRDGYSTAGSAGCGLGAVRRLADSFDLHTSTRLGTALRASVRRRSRPSSDARGSAGGRNAARGAAIEYGAVSVARRGEAVCGDAWAVLDSPRGALLGLLDGLGHGEGAAQASRAGIELCRRWVRERDGAAGPDDLLAQLDRALAGSRGAAAAAVHARTGESVARFAGIGNVVASVHVAGGATHRASGTAGTLGYGGEPARERPLGWPRDALLVLSSDGLEPLWRLDDYPGLARRHAGLIAAVLYRDFALARDDATVLVVRRSEAGGAGA